MAGKGKKENKNLLSSIVNVFFVILGGVIAGYGLESVLIPNEVSDGGVTGVSIMFSTITGVSLSVFLIILNAPFIWLGYKQIGKTFAIRSTIGIISLSISATLMHHVPTIIKDDTVLIVITGGILLGIGMGLALRNGGALDGTDMLAVLIAKKVPFSVGEIIMMINAFIFTFVSFVFGLEGAIASAVAYFIATRVIHVIEVGFSDSKAVMINTSKPEEVGDAITARLGRTVTYLYAKGGHSKEDQQIVRCVITRMEENKMKTIIKSIDEKAFFTFSDVAEVSGGSFGKKDIH